MDNDSIAHAEMTDDVPAWVTAVRVRGLTEHASVMLTIIEPLGPLSAEVLRIAQPAARLWDRRWSAVLGALAQALETPGGVDALRRQLDAPDTTSHSTGG